MATYGKKLLDSSGNVILPKTRSTLVYMENNTTVETTIANILNGTTAVQKARSLADNNVLRNYSLYATSTTNITRKTPIAIWDDVLKDSRPVDRAFYDVNGDQINTTYARRDGTSFSGKVTMAWTSGVTDTSGLQVMNALCQASSGGNVGSNGFIFRRK